MIEIATPKFRLGKLVVTPGALDALSDAGQTPMQFVSRHLQGDWGTCCQEDRQANEGCTAKWRPAALGLSHGEGREIVGHHRGGSKLDVLLVAE
jgi:hypothetical protein